MNPRSAAGWLAFVLVFLGGLTTGLTAAPLQDADEQKEEKEELRGVITHESGVAPGYTLMSPFSNGIAYLVDHEGQVVHTWESDYKPGLAPYLLPNGNLLRGIQLDLEHQFSGGGMAGGLQEFTWDGELVWEFHLASDLWVYHHDIEPLPNGNILMIAWESRTKEESLAMGRKPSHAGDKGFWPALLIEVEPLRPFGARVVWEWRAWDHLIQDHDPSLPNYGDPSEHPERIDINADVPREEDDAKKDDGAKKKDSSMSPQERKRLIALGYLDPDEGAEDEDDADADGDGEKKKETREEKRTRERADWLHLNGMDYNAELDQIVVSSWHMNEIWVIDHSTSTEQARGSTGGRSGRGGDLLYRWGNPAMYRQGDDSDRQLFHQHDPQWIPEGFPGAGNLTIFNNGRKRPEKEYSSVVEIVPPLKPDGTYAWTKGEAFSPAEPVWEYGPSDDENLFYASFISGAHRLRNGNTLATSGPQGRLIEVNAEREIVWDYKNPFGSIPKDGVPNDFTFGMFRATRIAPDHEGLRGRKLTPIDPQPKTARELFAERPKPGDAPTGWKPLFNKDISLTRWVNVNCAPGRTFNMRPNPDDEDETILICTGKPTGLLRSDRMYENFIAELEWRHMDEPSNAGFFLWADPLPAVGGPFTRGIEVQICNLGNGDWFTSHGDIFPIWGSKMTPDPRFRISGSRSMPKEDAYHVRPTGEWNHYRITAIDGSVTLEVNGKLVTAGSGCTPSKGYLCLESEGGELHVRNLKIWELPAGTHAADADRTASEATDHETLYSGVDLEEWEIVSGDWKSEDWRMTVAAADGVIERKLPKDAVDLFFDFKREAKASSAKLPFRIGDARFDAAGETSGKWNRVHVRLSESEIAVDFGGKRQTAPRAKADETKLVLVNDGIATEFCSVFVEEDV